MNTINYNYITQALTAYKSMGYKYLEVPWVISDEATNITLPKDRNIIRSNDGALIGSAEQSFIQLMLDKKLKSGKYVAATPCFRDDKIDELHQRYFFKVELIDYAQSDFSNIKENLNTMTINALTVMEAIGGKNVSLVETVEGFDIELDKIELGSYGYRRFDNNYWIYGTGIAEPRFSQAINIKGK